MTARQQDAGQGLQPCPWHKGKLCPGECQYILGSEECWVELEAADRMFPTSRELLREGFAYAEAEIAKTKREQSS